MKPWAKVAVALIVGVVAAWVATRYFGPVKLEKQLTSEAVAELRQIEKMSRDKDPKSPSAEQIFRTKLPIVKIALLDAPLPFVFEARTEVRTLPDSGEILVARYFFTPWRVYRLSVQDRRIIFPPIY